MIVTVTLNPSVDHALFVETITLGDTNRVSRSEKDAGGKGVNLSRVVDELLGRTLATGFLGGGPGAYVRAVLDAEGVPHDFLDIEGHTRVNFSVETAAGGAPTTFNERGPEISPSDWEALLRHVSDKLTTAKWLVAGGSLPPGSPKDAYTQLVHLGRERGVKVAIDADGEPMVHALAAHPDLIKPNADEAARLLGRELSGTDDALRAAHELRKQLSPAGIAIISLGAQGAVLAGPTEGLIGESPTVEAKSTIGSGDSLLAGFFWAHSQGMPLQECLTWGLAAGAATASTNGSEIARLPVIQRLHPQARVRAAE